MRISHLSNRNGNMRGNLTDFCKRGIDATEFKVSFGYLAGESLGRCEKHFIGHALRLSGNYPQPHAPKNVSIVTLTGNECSTGEINGIKWAAAGKYGFPLGPGVGFNGGAFPF